MRYFVATPLKWIINAHKHEKKALTFCACQVLPFQLYTTPSLRWRVRLCGFCGPKPSAPRMRQICVSLYLTPCRRLITTPIRLSVHGAVPKPRLVSFSKMARRNASGWPISSLAGQRRKRTSRNASIPPTAYSQFVVLRRP